MTRRTRQGVEHVLDVYETQLHLCTTRRQVDALRGQLPPLDPLEDGMAGTSSLTELGDDGATVHHVVFWIDARAHDGQPARLVNTVAHEAAHGAGSILGYVGDTGLDWKSEAAAYLTGWLAEWLWTNVS